MANPSLQIGNSNWAIKEDNLLGYSTAGTRFVPQPITMTRASAGTRVNSSGLVETVELLGGEEIVNGDFATDSNWTKGTGWSISGGTANCIGGAGSLNLTQVALEIGKTYTVTYTVSNYSAGTIHPIMGGWTHGTYQSSNGTYTEVISNNHASANTTFYMQGKSGFVGSIDNVSVKEYTANNLARVDYDGTASSLLVEPERINLITTSEDFDSYRVASSTVTPNSITAPDGTNSGILVTQGTNQLVLRANNVVAPSTTYTFSGYFKSSGSVTQVALDITDNGSTTFGLTSEWQRFSMTTESRGDGSPYHFVDVATNGIEGDTFYAWGLQLEEASYGTSYIPTDGSTVTRVQDQYSKTGISNLINSEEGVLFAEIAALSDDLSYRILSLSNGTSNERIYMQYTNVSNTIAVVVKEGGDTQANMSYVLSDETAFSKVAIKWKVNDFALWIDGVERATDTLGNTPVGLNRLALDNGNSSTGGNKFFSKVKQLQVFKTSLSDTQLAALTS